MNRMLTFALMIGMLHLVPYACPQETRPHPDDHRLRRVSLIRVIANPGEFDGEHIRVVGYLAGAGLDNTVGVYVSEVDGRNFILSNAIDLRLNDSAIRDLIGKYVIVSGLYHAPAPQGDFNGYIDHILQVKPLNSVNASK